MVDEVCTSNVLRSASASRADPDMALTGSVYEVPLNVAQAGAARDALARAIYNNLFDWIVDRINISMKAKAPSAHIIGVLDIYGFEIFDVSLLPFAQRVHEVMKEV